MKKTSRNRLFNQFKPIAVQNRLITWHENFKSAKHPSFERDYKTKQKNKIKTKPTNKKLKKNYKKMTIVFWVNVKSINKNERKITDTHTDTLTYIKPMRK